MQSMHRQFGKFLKRSADDSQVSVLLKDFDNADKLLTKIIEASKAWRDSWTSILSYQSRFVREFETLYNPIVGASEPTTAHEPVITPEATLVRVTRLGEEYESLQNELSTELNSVDDRMIKPAMDAKDHLQPLKKVMKKRDDKKLDFERYQGRADAARKKTKRSDRDNAALAKAENDLSKATEEYNAADEHLRTHLPSLITATFSILPHLLSVQIEIQNTLLALYYTTLHNYCEEQDIPSPPPPMETVIQVWEQDVIDVQKQIESINCLAQRKGGRSSSNSDEHKNGSNGSFLNGLAPRGAGMRKPSVSPNRAASRIPSMTSMNTEARPRINGRNSSPAVQTINSSRQHSPPDDTLDHSSHNAPSSHAPPSLRNTQRQASSPAVGIASMAAAAAKKKPPPPPPPRAGSSSNPAQFVTALYDFDAQGEGDLEFRTGDRIRVIKKTDSTDDWWAGELRGARGSFPANYCA